MASLRAARILVIVGVILAVAGLFAIFLGTSPSGSQGTAVIQPNAGGTEYFVEYSWSVLAGGSVQGTFSVVNGTPVTLFLFNDADYNAYVNGQNLTGLYTTTAVNGTISLPVTGWNTYHLIFQHASGHETQEQDVSVDLTSTGFDPGYFLGGLVALVLGIAMAAVGVRQSRRATTQAPSGVLDSRATYLPPPTPPAGPDTTPTGDGVYRVPPPLPGAAQETVTAGPAPQAAAAPAPTGDVVVTLENRSAATEAVQLVVNGAAVTSLTLPPGTTQVTSVTARLASPFGSMVTVQAVTSGGRRVEQSVFVGARGTAALTLRIG